MTAIETIDKRRRFLTTAVAGSRDRQIAFVIGASVLLAFTLIVPFARTPLAKMPAFIPSYEAALIFVDLLTAVLLLEQFVRRRSAAMLVLASGYLFDALIIVPHALSFPGAFTTTGLLGAGPQTTAWLYVFWHGGFPLFVMAYASLRRREMAGRPMTLMIGTRNAIFGVVAVLMMLVAALTWLATVGHDLLPVVMQGSDYSLLVTKGISPAVWLLTFVAMLMLWQKEQRVVDLWLMLVMWVWLFDIGLSAVIGSARFDLGFYAGRIFGLMAASFLLGTLLVELGQMYAQAVGAVSSAEGRIVELMRLRVSGDLQQAGKADPFVVSQNIARYRGLLESGELDTGQRAAIDKLLAEEEAKLPPQN